MNREKRTHKIYRWMQLFFSFFLLWLFIFVVAPLGERIESVDTFHRHIREKNIDASALFYTEIQEFSDADNSIRNTMKY